MKKQTLQIQGMHCRSCEILLEDALSEIKGVRQVTVNHLKGTAEVHYKGHLPAAQVKAVIEEAGYELGRPTAPAFISERKEDWNQLAVALTALVAVYFILRGLGIGDLGNSVSNNYASLPVVFLVGLTAGISTCMALVGGLVLGVSAKFAQQRPLATATEKFMPHLVFNMGRIVAFFILGGVIGWIGSVLQISLTAIGFLTVLVGLSMLVLGAQLTGVFPWLSSWQFTLPKSMGRVLGFDEYKKAEYSPRNTALLGALTFFLPCGFTQAMQLYAMSTGSPMTGALTMGAFALGTAPGLLGVGGLTAVVKGTVAQYFFKFSGLVVMALALYNISNGLNLAGWSGFSLTTPVQPAEVRVLGATEPQSVQVLKATYSPEVGLSPSTLKAKVGQPVRVEVMALEDGVGCMGSFAIPTFTRKVANFKKGEAVVMEFNPKKVGRFQMTCAMGVPHGTLVIES